MNIDFEYSNSYRGGNKWIEMVNVIALVIKTESKKEVGKREGGRNGREDALAISEMLLWHDYIKKNRSGLKRGGGGEIGKVGGGRNWMSSQRPRGEDLDHHDLTA